MISSKRRINPSKSVSTALKKQEKPVKVRSSSSPSAASAASASAGPSSSSLTTSVSPNICQFCDKGGFPTRKALKYHLFRIPRQPMKKASQQIHPSQDRTVISPNHDASIYHDSSSLNLPNISDHPTSPVNRQDARLSISFPIIGKLSCPEEGCAATFVSRSWTSMKGSLIKHLRFVHHVSIATCEFECGICNSKILLLVLPSLLYIYIRLTEPCEVSQESWGPGSTPCSCDSTIQTSEKSKESSPYCLSRV
ncbi:hypothetical protein CDAR_36271 [Caerostris darwini]|uniref:C2H2-type domain-containing protein n=1 Tax=Caerostris darwini TaxID=1538125 RepID=A0AAV4SCX7_9ARAC|nr:hypothetical protein CDAR_36271 [Caerostris darwini]